MDVEYKKISLKDLVKCPLNPREYYGNLEELKDTMINTGILEDLIVREVNGKYEVICGERRRKAGEEIGLKELPCKVYKRMSDAKARALIGVEDLQRKDLTPYERGIFYKKWLEKEKLTTRKLAAKLGCVHSLISYYLDFAKLDKEVGKQVRNKAVEGTSEAKTLLPMKARALIRLNPEEQKAMAKRIKEEGLPLGKVEYQVEQIPQIKALIAKTTDPKLKKKAAKEVLKPEVLVRKTYREVRDAYGLTEKFEQPEGREKDIPVRKELVRKWKEGKISSEKYYSIMAKSTAIYNQILQEDEKKQEEMFKALEKKLFVEDFDKKEAKWEIERIAGDPHERKKKYFKEDKFKDQKEAQAFAVKYEGVCLGKETFWVLEIDPIGYKMDQKKKKKKHKRK